MYKKKKKASLLLDELRIPNQLFATTDRGSASHHPHHGSGSGSGAAISDRNAANSLSPARKRIGSASGCKSEPSPLDLEDPPSGSGRLDGLQKTGFFKTCIKIRFAHPIIAWTPVSSCVGLFCCAPISVTGVMPGTRSRSSTWGSYGHVDLRDVITCRTEGATWTLYFVKRKGKEPWEWKMDSVRFKCATIEEAREWHAAIAKALRVGCQPHRPKALLLVINPYGGARRADAVWRDVVEPILTLAGVKAVVHRTDRPNHARELIEQLSLDQLREFDGIVAVGGDGLFHELVNGALHVRAQGGERAGAARKLRLGHIPAGSTDALAYSLHGTRCAATAALHIALGDRIPLDVLELHAQQDSPASPGALVTSNVRYAVCMCSYGYFGEVMRLSEGMRALGPLRYDVAGVWAFLKGAQWELDIRAQTLAPPTPPLTARGPPPTPSLAAALDPFPRGPPAGLGSAPLASSPGVTTPLRTSFLEPDLTNPGHSLPSRKSMSALLPGGPDSAGPGPIRPERPPYPPSTPSTSYLPPAPTLAKPAAAAAAAAEPYITGRSLAQIPPRRSRSVRGVGRPSEGPACVSGCLRCSLAPGGRESGRLRPPTSTSAAAAAAAGQYAVGAEGEAPWRGLAPGGPPHAEVHKTGPYKALMAAVIPCRSDRSPKGLAPGAHLSDGQVSLFLVRSCSRLQYLRLLIEIASRGLTRETPQRLPWVEVVDATGFTVRCLPPQPPGVWNVDGELVQCRQLAAQVHRGLIDVFARGVEVVVQLGGGM